MVKALEPEAAQRLLELKDRALASTAEGVTISNRPISGCSGICKQRFGFSKLSYLPLLLMFPAWSSPGASILAIEVTG